MTLPANVDRHPNTGDHIAYDADGFAFRVCKRGRGRYVASPSHAGAMFDGRAFSGVTLAGIAGLIATSRKTETA